MSDTLTANYSWVKPEVSASFDTWGTKWNVTLDALDVKIHTLDVAAASAKATTVDADYMGLYDSEASFALKKLTWAVLRAEALSDTAWGVFLKARANHTGVQAISTITDLSDSLDNCVAVAGDTMTGVLKVQDVGGHGSVELALSADTNPGSVKFRNNSATVFSSIGGISSNRLILSIGGTCVGHSFGGDIVAAGNIQAYSDRRLKDNIHTIDDALSKVERLRGVYYTMKGVAGVGVIAQEVANVVPEVVNEVNDRLTVAYGNLVGLLIEAVKDLSAQIQELKNK